jgi:uncharacterized protein
MQIMYRLRHRALLCLVLLGALAWTSACSDGTNDPAAFGDEDAAEAGPLPPRGHAWVVVGSDTVLAEVADTPEARERGLMHRTELADGHGMLFVFEDMAPRSFWMRDTYIPLDIAFLDRDQVIVDIQQMEPETDELTESAAPAMFALEVRQNWFAEQGIEVGAEARIVFGRR